MRSEWGFACVWEGMAERQQRAALAPRSGLQYEVIIVEDNSPDGTLAVAEELQVSSSDCDGCSGVA